MTHWILAGIGIVLALAMPRWKYFNLMGFAGLFGLLLGSGLLLLLKPSILLMALGVGLVVFGALLLGRWVPRLILLLMLLLTMAVTIGPKVDSSMTARVGAGIIALGLLVLGLVMVRFGLRLVWALLGALMVYSGDKTWLWISVALGLFILNWLTTRKVDYHEPAWKKVMGLSFSLSVLLVAGLLGCCFFWAKPFVQPGQEMHGSVEAGDITVSTSYTQTSLRDGIVWPLLSEAAFWGSPAFPAFENLDRRYLVDSDSQPPRPMMFPTRVSLSSRFELNSDIHKLRQIKSADEIKALQTSSSAIVAALVETLPLIHDGGGEGTVAKSVQERALKHGCEADSFPPIVASGEHALDFHYMDNDGAMKAGELLVIDIGCYTHHYASDFTRTLPVSGKFSERQKKLYSAVYDSQQAAAKACKPGVYLYGSKARGGQKTLNMVVRETLKAHGVPGDFGHGVGHPLGLFVHDVFDRGTPLKAGMVIMIEPGLYLEDEKTGIRLEDAYLVTKDGCELMTTGFPADPDSVEKMMGGAQR